MRVPPLSGLAIAIFLFIAAILIWWVGPWIAMAIHDHTLLSVQACISDANAPACENTFSRLGQTGDLFGSISSLFSGLALLGIALTIWHDVNSRRMGRKPLIVCRISDDKPVTFDDVNYSKPRAIRVGFDLDVQSLNDVAVNVVVDASLSSTDWKKSFNRFSVPLPLSDGGMPQTVSLKLRLDDGDLAGLVEAQKRNGPLLLSLVATAESLEGVKWETSVDFILQFRKGDDLKIQALVGDDEACKTLWADQATVQAENTVKPGTWRHRKIA